MGCGLCAFMWARQAHYTQIIEVSDLSRSQTDLELPVGEYFIAMSAVDTDGTESALSNEVRRVVQ